MSKALGLWRSTGLFGVREPFRVKAFGRQRSIGRRVAGAAVAAFLLALPLFANEFLLSGALFCAAAAVGAVGLTVLVGTAGQLSLAHAFFVAIGAYAYAFLAAGGASAGGEGAGGLGLPTPLAATLAVACAAAIGGLFSPIAVRLRGIYLGVASLSLVFLGQHVLFSAASFTGGFNGRNAPALSLLGVTFGGGRAAPAAVGMPIGERQRLWYLSLALVLAACTYATRLQRSRAGRALRMVRDHELPAAVIGVDVRGHKAKAFAVSGAYGGCAGVLVALAFRRIVPDYFGLELSLEYLAMILIGGVGSVRGAVCGAVLVTGLPLLLARYAPVLPFLAEPAAGGVDPAAAARFVFGAAVVAVVLVRHGAGTDARRRGVPADRRKGVVPKPRLSATSNETGEVSSA